MAQTSKSRKTQSRRRKTARASNLMVLKLLLLVIAVLVVFEGRLIGRMLSQTGSGVDVVQAENSQSAENTVSAASDAAAAENTGSDTAQAQAASADNGSDILAGLSVDGSSVKSTSAEDAPSQPQTESAVLTASYVVPEQPEPVDDSYFRDAVFIGDSRMEGFRNASGITQGDFMTSVGMSIDALETTQVATSYGSVTIYQGLSGKQYGKIYLMLGANDLGYYPWDDFLPDVEAILKQFHELQPNAIIYVCSCIYVDESLVTTSYVNNENVIRVNDYLLQACDDLDYCWYVNLNEIFDNGYHALLSGASQDGVHLYADYLKQMLSYLKSHYIPVEPLEEEAEPATEL